MDVQLLRKMTIAQIRKYLQWDQVQQDAARLYEEAHYGESMQSAAVGAADVPRDGWRGASAVCGQLEHDGAGAPRLGEDAEARPLCQQALNLRRKLFGEIHPVFCESLDDMAELLMSLNEPREATRLYASAVEHRKAALGHAAHRLCDEPEQAGRRRI